MPRRCGRPVGVGFFAVSQMASLASPSLRQKPAGLALSRSALKARDALVLEHLPLADGIASATARRLFPLVEREDLIQVARETLVRSAPRCRAGEPPAPYLRRCITGGLQRQLRDRVRLVRVPIACMSSAAVRWGTSALMPALMASRAYSISWLPLSPSQLPAGPSSSWR